MPTRAEMTGSSCPVGCGRHRRSGHLMCATCWREVPAPLQRDVHRTWRAWTRDLRDAEAMRAYRQASDTAIASIR